MTKTTKNNNNKNDKLLFHNSIMKDTENNKIK